SHRGRFSSPEGLAVDRQGNLYVADTQNHRIQKFSPQGGWLLSWGELGTGPGEFVEPTDVAIDPEGKVWVVDTGNHRLQRFEPTGRYLGEIGRAGKKPGELDSPRGMAIDAEGRLYVADTLNSRIQVFGLSGDLLWVIGHPGREAGAFYYPNGVAIDAHGALYVADTINHRIQRFTFSPPVAYLEEGWKAYQAGEYRQAIAHWTNALDLDPMFYPARYALGVALLHEGKYAEAREYFQTTLSLAPHYGQARWRMYQSYLYQFRWLFLLSLSLLMGFGVVLWTRRHRRHTLWQQAEEQRKKGDFQAAIALYEQVLALKRNDLAVCKALEELYRREGMEDRRMQVNQTIARLEPRNLSALTYLGKALIARQELAEAATVWRQVLQVAPADRNGNFYLGLIAAETGKREEAAACFQQALAPLPTPQEEAALQAFLEEDYRDDPLSRFLREWQEVLTTSSRYQGAGQVFQATRHHLAQEAFQRGKRYLEDGSFAQAVVTLRHAVSLVPEDERFQEAYRRAQTSLLFERGMHFYETQQYAEAISCFRKVLGVDPLHSTARRYLRYAQQCLEGDFSERFKQLDLREGEE
ncbi:MAG: tetratricopeptide repeat protein, partial [Nitrospinota bacterium]